MVRSASARRPNGQSGPASDRMRGWGPRRAVTLSQGADTLLLDALRSRPRRCAVRPRPLAWPPASPPLRRGQPPVHLAQLRPAPAAPRHPRGPLLGVPRRDVRRPRPLLGGAGVRRGAAPPSRQLREAAGTWSASPPGPPPGRRHQGVAGPPRPARRGGPPHRRWAPSRRWPAGWGSTPPSRTIPPRPSCWPRCATPGCSTGPTTRASPVVRARRLSSLGRRRRPALPAPALRLARVTHFAVTAVGADRPGIVAAVTGAFVDHGCNLEDSSMTILRGQFAMMLVVDAPAGVGAGELEAGAGRPGRRLSTWSSPSARPPSRPRSRRRPTSSRGPSRSTAPTTPASCTGSRPCWPSAR